MRNTVGSHEPTQLPIMKTMMLRTALATATILAVTASPAVAAKTRTVDALAQAKVTKSGKLAVRIDGRPFGTCFGTITLVSKGAIFRTKCKGSRIVVRTRYGNAIGSRGTWKVVSATGRYRNGSGRGTYSGNVAQLKFVLRGKLRY